MLLLLLLLLARLSYTTFDLKWSPQPPPRTFRSRSACTTYHVTVANTGAIAGDEVVLAFFKPDGDHTNTGAPVPKKQLFGFQRVTLAAGAKTTLSFSVSAEQLAMVDVEGHRSVYSGKHTIIFTRGHGDELEAPLAIDMPRPERISTFRRWW